MLYAFNKTFQPFHGDGSGAVAVTIPESSDAGQVGEAAGRQGRDRLRALLRAQGDDQRRPGKLRPGEYTLKKGMTNGAVIAALTKVPETRAEAPRPST